MRMLMGRVARDLYRFKSTLCLLLVSALLSVSLPVYAEQPEADVDKQAATLRVAILTDDQSPDAEKLSNFSELLGVMLQEGEGIALLERDQFEMVLEEIKVSQLVGADAVSQRLKASTMLDAEAMVLVHRPEGQASRVAVTLMETSHGLRLSSYQIQNDTDMEQAAENVADSIRSKLKLTPQALRVIVAVPPFVDARLDPEPKRYGVQLAEAVQAVAENSAGVLVLEVDEARALAREMKIRGDDRLKALPDPLFLTGRITTSTDGRHAIEVKADRNGHEPVTRLITCATLAELTAGCLTESEQLIAVSANGMNQDQPSNDTALQRIIQSAKQLELVGDAYQAYDLVEMAVLLNPDDPVLRDWVMQLIAIRMSHIAYQRDVDMATNQKHEQLFELLELGLGHHYAELNLILRHGNRELRDRKNHSVVSTAKRLIFTYSYCAKQIESDGAVVDYAPVYDLLTRHTQRLYHLVINSDDQAFKGIRFYSIAQLFYYIDLPRPDTFLSFEQQLTLYQRFQENPNARLIFLNLWGSMPIDRLRESIALMDKNLGRLSLRGQISYENGLSILLGNGMFLSGPVHRSPEIDNKLKQINGQPVNEPEPADDALQVKAHRIDLFVSDPDSEDGHRAVYPKGWLDAGPYGELVYDDWHVYLVSGVDQIRTVLSVDPELRKEKQTDEKIWIARRLTRPCFDGRYIWVGLISDPGHLFIVDLQTFKVSHFSEDDGVFPMGGGVAIAPLGEGDVLVTASTMWDGTKARVWSGRTRFGPEDGLAIKIIFQAMPGEVIDGLGRGGNIRNAVTLFDPAAPDNKYVAVDNPDELRGSDRGLKLIISPDSGDAKVLRWGKYDFSGLGLAMCYVHDGRLYFNKYRMGGEPVLCYTPGVGRFDLIRPGYEGQWITGTVHHADAYLAVDEDGNLWGARSLTDIARKIGPLSPVINPSNYASSIDYDGDRYQSLWECSGLFLFSSEYYGLIGWHHTVTSESNHEDHKSWSIDLRPESLAVIDEPPAIPPGATRLKGRALLTVGESVTYSDALRIADAYGARLATISDRVSYDQVAAVASGSGKRGHHWVGLKRIGNQVLNLNGDNEPVEVDGVPLGGAKEGYVLARWSPPALTGAPPESRHKFILEWPIDPDDNKRELAEAADHPGPAWLPVVELPAGRFTMGNPDPDSPFARIEPRREVEIPAGLWMATTEVTVDQYNHVMNRGPVPDGRPSTPQRARSINRFCKRLSQMTGLHYRIPTEEEWEYACRAGTDTRYASGDAVDDLRRIGWCSYDGILGSAGNYAFVRSFEPNAWGLYDMHGNLGEYTCTYLGKDMQTRRTDPKLSDIHRLYIIRGGSWVDPPSRCRSASRRVSDSGSGFFGFRLLLDTREDQQEGSY